MTGLLSAATRRRPGHRLHDPRIVSCLVALLAFAAPSHLASASDVAVPPKGFQLNVLPKSLQANPVLNMTVVTEFTALGRTQPKASIQRPLYCVLHDGGFQSRGDAAAGEKAPPPAHLARVLHEALAQQGLLTADAAGAAPQLALFYSWGSHAVPDADFRTLFPEAAHRSLVERAALVGGKSFVRELGNYNENIGLWSMFSFEGREKTRRFLFDQANADLNYVVISAYAFDDLARNERHLLWRTTMTVEATGVSLSNTLPALVLTAAPYVGREVPALAIRRTIKRGTVELGPARIVDDDVVAAVAR